MLLFKIMNKSLKIKPSEFLSQVVIDDEHKKFPELFKKEMEKVFSSTISIDLSYKSNDINEVLMKFPKYNNTISIGLYLDNSIIIDGFFNGFRERNPLDL